MKNINVRYDITIDFIEENYSNIKIKDIIEKNTNGKLIRTGKNTYTGIIYIDELKKHDILIKIEWENNEDENELDSEIGTNLEETKVPIPIEVSVSQYGNETIEEYVEEEQI